MAQTYKDIIVYIIFFTIIIFTWALIGSTALKFDESFVDENYPQNIDPYKSNYNHLPSMIFIMYVTATFDAYPDNQTLSIQNSEFNYIFFIVFVFMNMFLFSFIPGLLIYTQFREARSKLILLESLNQQTSLILAFVTLCG